MKYLGRYLKRPPVSASRLRHYGGRGGPPLPRSPHGEA
ncbi:transposase [Klebsiella pneumoniae]|nr:transposase [Klebsiella pneumoniae]MCF1175636.1 transposase [Klebsiella pneumoniae]MCQ0804609.1 transposase [Klebsiella pneumoniae]MCQ0850816.1 transposase [Klebsiella pneumoniae]MCY0510424.1 transposase [Klebsiella pneumoniae]